MSYLKISQRDARELRKQVNTMLAEEERRRFSWAREWPLGTEIGRLRLADAPELAGAIKTARKLKHAVVITCDEAALLTFHALPIAEWNRP